MEVDIQSLETFNQLASEGAQQATAMLAQMTGIQAEVEVTKITLMDRADVGEELAGQAFVGIGFDLEGALVGDTTLVFEEACTGPIVEALPGGAAGEEMVESSVKEIGNIMMSGFIDGWADFLRTTIEHSPPRYVEATGADVFPAANDPNEQVFVFKSHIQWPGEDLSFYIYMLPAYDRLTELMADSGTGDDAVPVDKLSVFNEMTKQGTATAADNVTQMTGIETDAEVTQISFAPIEDVPKQVDNKSYVGTAVEFSGTPSGYLMILFDETSAMNVAEALMPMEPDGEGFTDMHESAIEEMGNIMTSGFIDGWANVLETSVDHTPPRVVHDMGRAIIDPLAAQVGQQQEHAFIIESRMQTADLEFGCEIHALPDDAELRQALGDLDVTRKDQTEPDVETIFE
ncbi:chemotaxis protein CheC [Halorientalis sp.]|jgi:chemotaxis protein CheY-P-specific phosphatase CheC|uniref:chemotaxis protein CheC n=1 Tax=Halorientalis sp. TaxID=1931229 RepID=UPI002601D83C|nr:chemotaxis protein CheC [Halorientalis sp.]